MYSFFRSFLPCKNHNIVKKSIAFIITYVLLFTGSMFFKDNSSLLVLNALIITAATGIFMCKSKMLSRIFASILFVVITVTTETVASLIVAEMNAIEDI